MSNTNSLVFTIDSLRSELHRLEQHTRLRMVTFDWNTASAFDRLSLTAQLDRAQDLRDEIDGMIRLLQHGTGGVW